MKPFLFFVLLLAALPVLAQEEEITSGKDDLSAINVLLIDGQGTHNFSPRCCQKDLMPVGYLYLRKFDHITFYAALFKFRDDVKNPHVMFLLSGPASGL